MTLSTYICLCGFLACLAALAAMKTRRICRDVWRSFTGRRGVSAALAAFAVVVTICAQKPNPPVITVDSFLADAGSYATNDVLHVAVTNAVIPASTFEDHGIPAHVPVRLQRGSRAGHRADCYEKGRLCSGKHQLAHYTPSHLSE